MRVHNRTRWLPLAALLAGWLLTACAGSAAPANEAAAVPATLPPAVELPAVEPAAQPTATAAPEAAPAQSTAGGEVSFARDVLPILQNKCMNCHGGQRTAEGLDMKTYEALMAGSKNGSVITPGDASRSSFVTLSAEGKMPKRGPKLTDEEIRLLTDWVNAGAPNN